jgi:hypothetical protein
LRKTLQYDKERAMPNMKLMSVAYNQLKSHSLVKFHLLPPIGICRPHAMGNPSVKPPAVSLAHLALYRHFLPLETRVALKPAYFNRVPCPAATLVDPPCDGVCQNAGGDQIGRLLCLSSCSECKAGSGSFVTLNKSKRCVDKAFMSRTTVQHIKNLETQTEEFKSAIDEFDNDIRRHSKEDDEYGFEASKPNPEGWSEYIGFNSGFEAWEPNSEDWSEQFDQPMNNPKVPEVDKGLMRSLGLALEPGHQEITCLGSASDSQSLAYCRGENSQGWRSIQSICWPRHLQE